MNGMKKIIILWIFVALLGTTQAMSENFFNNISIYGRVGYSLGGTAPVGLPASIRSLNKYNLRMNLSFDADFEYAFNNQWGVLTGFHLESKNMEIDATVKNYHMEMRQGGESIEGMFTGNVITNVDEEMVTIPLQASYKIGNKFRFRLGPYVSFLFTHNFSGSAYDGYIRVGNPTGNKVEIGSDEGTRGTYDFSDNMRKVQYGVACGAEWYLLRRLGVFFDLSWGLTGIFHSSFKTIEQTMYPIYGTIGLTYKFR